MLVKFNLVNPLTFDKNEQIIDTDKITDKEVANFILENTKSLISPIFDKENVLITKDVEKLNKYRDKIREAVIS
jgi:hypothetical protein